MARSNPYYARKAKRQADAARNVERIYRDLDNQKWARDFVDNLYGPLGDGRHNLPAPPPKPSRGSWRSPPEDEARRKLHPVRPMKPEDYDPSKTINVPEKKAAKDFRKWGGFAKAARKAASFSRFMGPFGRLWDLWDLYEDFREERDWSRYQRPVLNPGDGWWLSGQCGGAVDTDESTNSNYFICIGNQALRANPPFSGFNGPTPTHRGYALWKWNGNSAVPRYNYRALWFRSAAAASAPQEYPLWAPGSWVPSPFEDPNLIRDAPPRAQYEDPIKGAHERAREALSWADEAANIAQDDPVYQWTREISLADGSSSPPSSPPPFATREPPSPGTRERKVIPRGRATAIAVWRAVDRISEAAEVVDAFYDALPADVRKRWKCPANRGLADTAGQYGIDGADCKARALWHNWDKVDVEQAIRNVVKNQIADKIIGGYQSKLPKNTGSAHEDGEKLVAKWIDDFLDGIGL